MTTMTVNGIARPSVNGILIDPRDKKQGEEQELVSDEQSDDETLTEADFWVDGPEPDEFDEEEENNEL
jgi:hypothetical protein